MKYLMWLLKAAIFFTLFAFALNNQQIATVHFFFGTRVQSPMVLVVLVAFAAGLVVGVLGMVPRWLMHRKVAKRHALAQSAAIASNKNTALTTPSAGSGTITTTHGT